MENRTGSKGKSLTLPRVLAVVAAVAALVAVGASFSWAGPCTGVLELAKGNAVPMRCAYAQKAVALMGVVLAIVAAKSAVTGKMESWAIVLLSIAMIAVTFESAFGIGVCKSEMACWTMAAWVRGCAAVSGVCGLVAAVLPLFKKQVR